MRTKWRKYEHIARNPGNRISRQMMNFVHGIRMERDGSGTTRNGAEKTTQNGAKKTTQNGAKETSPKGAEEMVRRKRCNGAERYDCPITVPFRRIPERTPNEKTHDTHSSLRNGLRTSLTRWLRLAVHAVGCRGMPHPPAQPPGTQKVDPQRSLRMSCPHPPSPRRPCPHGGIVPG